MSEARDRARAKVDNSLSWKKEPAEVRVSLEGNSKDGFRSGISVFGASWTWEDLGTKNKRRATNIHPAAVSRLLNEEAGRLQDEAHDLALKACKLRKYAHEGIPKEDDDG